MVISKVKSNENQIRNKFYNIYRDTINKKYKHKIDIFSGFDYSDIDHIIEGFADLTIWGVTVHNNIVCLTKGNNYRRLIESYSEDIEPIQKELNKCKIINKNTSYE